MHRDPEQVRPQHEHESVQEVQADSDRVPAETPAPRRAPDQEEPAGDREIDDERVDRRAHRLAQALGDAVDEVRHAETDDEAPLASGRVEHRVQDRSAADPVEPRATAEAALQELKAKEIAAADG